MAEFLTMAEAEDKFGKKGRTNAAASLRKTYLKLHVLFSLKVWQ